MSVNGMKSPRLRQDGESSPRSNNSKALTNGTTAKPLDLGPSEMFLKQDFDVTSFARDAMMSHEGPESVLKSLKSQLETVELAISTHVTMHEDSLLGTLEAVGSLKREMLRGKNDSNTLLVSLGRVEADFREPFERLKTTSQSLKNAHEATGVLRKLGWFLVARKKLKATLEESKQAGGQGSGKDASKAAQLVSELEELLSDGGLKGVSIVDAEAKWIKEAGMKVRQDAQKALEKAIVTLNQGEMGLALQAFFHLNILEDRVSYATVWAAKEFTQEVREALRDASSGGSTADPSQKLQNLRTKTDAMLERSLRSWAVRVWNLQRVLTKKRDPTTHVLFADVVNIEVFDQFWNRATAALEQELKTCARWVHDAMVEDYARLRRSARAMLGRLWTSTSSVSGTTSASAAARKLAVGGPKETQALMQAFHPFLREFLGKCLSRLNQPVMVMFPEEETRGLRHVEPRSKSTIPTANDVQTFAQIIARELNIVKGDAELTSAVAQSCAMAVTLFYEKSQALVSKSEAAHAFRLIAPELAFTAASASAMPVSSTTRTSVQEHNVNVLTLVSQLSTKLKETIDAVAAAARPAEGQIAFGDDAAAIPSEDNLEDEGDDEIVETRIVGEEDEAEINETFVRTKTPQPPSNAPPPSASFTVRLEMARNQLDLLISEILDDYVGSEQCFRSLDDLLQDINAENYNVATDNGVTRSYTAKFSKACRTLKEEHLNKLPSTDAVCLGAVAKLTARLMQRVSLRVSMVRPLGDAGRQMLARDIQSLSDTLLTICMGNKPSPSTEELLKSQTKGLTAMITKERGLVELVQSGSISKVLAWHHLFAEAPSDVHSPHTKAGKPLQAYLSDVEQGELTQVWTFVSACLIGKPDSVKHPFEKIVAI